MTSVETKFHEEMAKVSDALSPGSQISSSHFVTLALECHFCMRNLLGSLSCMAVHMSSV